MVSIIITVFNNAHFLKRALHYAKNQTLNDIEIVVVDDGSNQENKAILESFNTDIDLIISYSKNAGPSYARNKGISAAKGEFILTWDVDDFFDYTFCKEAVKEIQKNNLIKAVTCFGLLTADFSKYKKFKPLGGGYENFLFDNASIGTCLFKKTDWAKIKGFDEKLIGFEDWDFLLRLLYPRGEVFVIKEYLFTYFRHPNTITNIANKKKYELRSYLIKKNEQIYQNHFDDLINDLTKKIILEEQEKFKNLKRKEYILGYYILKPLRMIKSTFRIYFNLIF